DQCVRQTVQTLTQLWADTMDKITREIPVVQRIADMDEAAEGPAQSRENPEPEQRSPNQMIGQPGTAYGRSRRRNRQPHHSQDVDQWREEKCAIAPSQDEIAHHRSGQNEFH